MNEFQKYELRLSISTEVEKANKILLSMNSFLLFFLMTAVSLSGIAQNINANSPFRAATEAEMELHDNAYNTLQKEINSKLCAGIWEIIATPFLIKAHRKQPVLIIDYYKKFGNIPAYTRENETFRISLKKGSELYESYMDSMNQTPINIHTIDRISNEMEFADITLLLNQSQTYELKGSFLPKIPGVQEAVIYEEKPSEAIPYSSFSAVLYIGSWPKLTNGKITPFPFIKNSGDPIIENMIITLDAVNQDKLMKIIHTIDWTKMEALVKNQKQ